MSPPKEPAAGAPPVRPPRNLARRAFAVLSSPRLAIALLVTVLACCVVGVTVFTNERAGALIFSTLWFNGLLVLLAVSSGLTFLVRVWGRKLTLISVGMIVFHVCFLAMLGGVVFNSLYHFRAVLRLTEGETLPNGDSASYDSAEAGRFFDFGRLRGETTLVKMHRDYQVDGKNKRAAYEITVGEGNDKTTDTIYITQNLDRGGVRYLVSKEGYSLGIAIHDKKDKGRGELFAIMVPLQSLAQRGGGFVYVTGTSEGPDAFPMPPPPQPPLLWLQLAYLPRTGAERQGEVAYEVMPPGPVQGPVAGQKGKVAVGLKFDAGDYLVEVREVRYWVGMTVRYDPGLTLILTSLWAGLGGMTMTFIGRIRQDSRRSAKA